MRSLSGPTSVKVTAAVSSTGDGQGGGRVGAGLVVSALGLTIGSGRELLRDVNFAAAPGTLTAIIGPSGAGKSILAPLVSGMIRPSSDTVTFAVHDVHAEFPRLRRTIGLVPRAVRGAFPPTARRCGQPGRRGTYWPGLQHRRSDRGIGRHDTRRTSDRWRVGERSAGRPASQWDAAPSSWRRSGFIRDVGGHRSSSCFVAIDLLWSFLQRSPA
jgi:hypothetical protein